MGRGSTPIPDAPLIAYESHSAWSEVDFGKDIGVKRTPRLREATTDADGAFVLCGIPAGVKGTIQAQRGVASTAEVPVEMGDAPLILQSLTMSSIAGTHSTPIVGRAVLTGRVTDKSGLPLADARVVVQGAKAVTTTGKDGSFHLEGLPSGTRAVLVRHIGYAPNEIPVDLANATPVSIAVALDKQTQTMDAVKIEGKMDEALRKNGFLDRKQMGMGHFGTGRHRARAPPAAIQPLLYDPWLPVSTRDWYGVRDPVHSWRQWVRDLLGGRCAVARESTRPTGRAVPRRAAYGARNVQCLGSTDAVPSIGTNVVLRHSHLDESLGPTMRTWAIV